MKVIEHEDGEVEIKGDLEELNTVDDFLALLYKVGATITYASRMGDKHHATIALKDGRANIDIWDFEKQRAPDSKDYHEVS